MTLINNKYCLDANVLIKAWNEYYSPNFCPGYWDVLNGFGEKGMIFIPETVFDEIVKTDDELSNWLKQSKIPVQTITEQVTVCLQNIYAKNPLHRHLVDNIKQRSLADPWIIAHAMNENAIVVTKENKETAINTTRIKIPNVCENMGIRCINDFKLIEELDIQFTCVTS